jgi:hypothetical protein
LRGPIAPCLIDQPTDQVARALGSAMLQHRSQGIAPLLGFDRVEVARFGLSESHIQLLSLRASLA